jgi:toxin ParE1/3/4
VRRLIVSQLANRDIDEIVVYLHDNEPRVAHRFLSECQAAIEMLAKFPEAGVRLVLDDHPELDFRYVRPKGFDWYLIFYRLNDTTIDVARVLHGSRNLAAALE